MYQTHIAENRVNETTDCEDTENNVEKNNENDRSCAGTEYILHRVRQHQ